jgi:hypothetical protein
LLIGWEQIESIFALTLKKARKSLFASKSHALTEMKQIPGQKNIYEQPEAGMPWQQSPNA